MKITEVAMASPLIFTEKYLNMTSPLILKITEVTLASPLIFFTEK